MSQTPANHPNKFYVTTPIYYINDRPHIGHAYSTIAADTLARYWRGQLGPENVLFSTGTDENSKKTIEAAKEAGRDVSAYTDHMAEIWKTTWDKLDITYDDFIRTSESRHAQAAQHFIQKIFDAGDISKGTYEGPYCFRCEAFYKEDELIEGEGGQKDCCPVHKKPVEVVSEENYFFDLPKYAGRVRQAIETGELEIKPEARRNEVLSFIDQGLDKISISRANQDIGIPLPFDPDQRTYVWVEALINYLTVAGYPEAGYEEWWANVTHIVGKDIIKFHCIIWPALLLSAGLTLPRRVFAHGFFTINGEKISKSLGNAIDPLELTAQYGIDPLRYYLLREIPFGADGNFSTERFAEVYTSELANTIGNLVQRVATFDAKHFDGKFLLNQTILDEKNADNQLLINQPLEALDFHKALFHVVAIASQANVRLADDAPWKTIKEDTDQARLAIETAVTSIIELGSTARYFLPNTAEKIVATFHDGRVNLDVGLLFPRIEAERADG